MDGENPEPNPPQMCMIRVIMTDVDDERAFALKKKLTEVVGDSDAKIEFSLTNIPTRPTPRI